MLDGGRDDVAPLVGVPEGNALQCQIVRLRTAPGEDDAARSGSDELGDGATGTDDCLAGVAAALVDARRVAVGRSEVRQHGVAHFVGDLGGGVVVEVDPPLRAGRCGDGRCGWDDATGGASCGLVAVLELRHIAEQGLVDGEAGDLVVVVEIGEGVHVPLSPGLRSDGGSTAHVGVDGSGDDGFADFGAEGHGASRGAHFDEVTGLDPTFGGVGGVDLNGRLRAVRDQAGNTVML